MGTVSGCDQPDSVETVEDLTGYPAGVYTKVVWQAGSLAAGSHVHDPLRRGIPQRANTMTWTGAEPDTSGAQAANLDNNNGASTREDRHRDLPAQRRDRRG